MAKSMGAGFFEAFFYGSLGGMAAFAMVGLISAVFLWLGVSLIKNYNKEGTKPLEELQTEQYFGVVLCGIGLFPWLRYFIAGFGLEAGERLFNELV